MESASYGRTTPMHRQTNAQTRQKPRSSISVPSAEWHLLPHTAKCQNRTQDREVLNTVCRITVQEGEKHV